jgi:hypothetical protein
VLDHLGGWCGKVLLLLDLVKVEVGNFGLVAIDDLGEFLESGATSLDVHLVDKAELEEDPDLLF